VSDPDFTSSGLAPSDLPPSDLTPVAPPEHLKAELPAGKGDFYSRCVFVLSILLGLAAFAASAIGFAGFAENDQNFTHLFSAFTLSFGVGALAFVPLGIIAFYARKAIWVPLPKFRAVIVLLLIFPWFFLGYYLLQIGGKMTYFAAIIPLTALFIGIWAIWFLKAR